jgi:hypothetical protein
MGSFDCAGTSLREVSAALKMTDENQRRFRFPGNLKVCSSQNVLASNILCEAYLRLKVWPIAIIRRFYDDEDY